MSTESKRNRRRSRLKLSIYEGRRLIYQMLFGRFKRKRSLKVHTRRTIFVWTLLSPAILSFLVFWLYVNFDSIMMAFQNIDYAAGGKEYWTLKNFKTIYTMFTEGLWGIDLAHCAENTMKYWVLGLFMSLPHSFFLTYAFQKKLAGSKFFRVVLYLPSILCGVVVAGIFESFISYKGVLGSIMREVFDVARVPAWFQEDAYATNMLLVYSFFFGFAGSYIIFSGAMGRISREITEAAYMDGVTMWQEIWYIIIPQMWPTLSMSILTSFTGIFGASGSILLFTPKLTSTFTLSYFIFDQVRVYNNYYVPAALGFVFTVVTLPICLIVKRIVDNIYPDAE